jgi:hypothetical protein
MATQKSDKAKNEGAVEIIAVFFAVMVGLGGVIWLFASNRIVWASLSPLLGVGSMWKWLPFDFSILHWNSLVQQATEFAKSPSDVSVFSWIGFVNAALLPLSIFFFLVYLGAISYVAFRKRSNVARKINPDMLLAHTLKTFTGIAPVLKIRKQIVENKLKEWREQVSPEEVFSGKVGNRSMVASGEFDKDVARDYFTGISGKKGSPDGRAWSRMLGWQVVHLVNDRKSAKPVVFPDRLSSEGKALMGLWAAVAFGGDDGKKEYSKYKDLLNMAAYGSPTGLTNLTVAEPLFRKYRTNKDVMQLFAVHHWEHTFLFALLEIAQRRGRYTTADVLWLRPANRVMFVSLNSCGSKAPHTESASTFSQFGYERMCAQLEVLPLVRQEDGEMIHVVSIERCVDGLKADYEHWKVSTDDNKDWWTNQNLWKSRDAAITRALAESRKLVVPPEPPGEDAEFDKQQAAARAKIDADEKSSLDGEFSTIFGE